MTAIGEYHRRKRHAQRAAERIRKLEAALREARRFIDADSPDWRAAKQQQLRQIDEALGVKPKQPAMPDRAIEDGVDDDSNWGDL